jgi:[ribosomal protein S18]-alanine N-acetyltransferase
MEFRSYEPSDRAACLSMFNSNVPVFFDPSELILFENFLDKIEQGMTGKAENIEEHYYVQEVDGKLTGCGGIALRETGDVVCMAWGMVDNSLHRRGYGRELLKFRLQKMEEIYPNVKIVLDTTQHSFRFFEKFGFSITKFTEDAYAPGMHRYDMVKEG